MATEKNENKFMVSEDRYDRICTAVQSRYQEMPENLFFTKEDIDRYLMPELQTNFPFLVWLYFQPANSKYTSETKQYISQIICDHVAWDDGPMDWDEPGDS